MQTTGGLTWGNYTRISEDPNDTQKGVTRQKADGEQEIEKRGGRAVLYPENDTSAYKRKRVELTDPLGNKYVGLRVIRPVWHRALHDLRSGKIQALMVWDLDRLARDPRDLEDAIEVVELYGATIVSASASEIDLTTESGIFNARLMVLIANKASADTARRVKRARKDERDAGRAMGRRPFGWKADRITLDPKESALVRDAVAALLAGASFTSIVRQWNEAGVLTAQGNQWQVTTLKNYLKNPRLYGARTYQREVHVDTHGKPVMGEWEPLLDEETYDRIQLLVRPGGKSKRMGSRKYLLAGVLRCGVCNRKMYGNARGDGQHFYACHRAGEKNEHSVSIAGRKLDDMVSELVVQYIARGPQAAPLEASDPYKQDIEDIEQQIADLMEAFRKKEVSSKRVFPMVGALEEELEGKQKSREQWLVRTTVPASASVSVEQWRDEFTDDQRRAYVDRIIEAIYVMPRTEGSARTFDPGRVGEPVWRDRS